jgi:hypothetical protein
MSATVAAGMLKRSEGGDVGGSLFVQPPHFFRSWEHHKIPARETAGFSHAEVERGDASVACFTIFVANYQWTHALGAGARAS